jgi:5-methylcytosine-specific restriction endonuclease McrA
MNYQSNARATARGNTEKSCPACGITFRYYASWPRIYCSKVCSATAQAQANSNRITKQCATCGVSFTTIPSQDARFCSRACFGRSLSAREVHPSKGRRYAFKARTEWIVKSCPVCGKLIEGAPVHTATRQCCSKTCSGVLLSQTNCGPANPLWQGGRAGYYGPTWQTARRYVRARDKVCQCCGKSPADNGKALDVHHIRPFRLFGQDRRDEANDPANLIALCTVCHTATEWNNRR